MTDSMIPSSLYGALVVYVIFVFILLYLRFTSEFVTSNRFKKLFSILSSVFIVFVIILFFLHRPHHNRVRLSVLPVIPNSTEVMEDWLPWAISQQADICLKKALPHRYLVYPIEWILEAIDFDSLGNQRYLLNFAKRISLDYIAIAHATIGCTDCPIPYRLIQVRSGQVLFDGHITPTAGEIAKAGAELARAFAKELGYPFQEPKCDSLTASVEINEYLIKTILALQEKQYAQAINYAEKAFAADSTSIPIRNLLAKAYLQYSIELGAHGKPNGLQRVVAYKICERTLLKIGEDAETHRLVGRYYLLRKMWGKAEEHLKKAIEMDPDNADAYLDYSRLHRFRMKKIGFKNEEALLRWTIRLNPCFEEARIILADDLYFGNWPNRAVQELDKLLAIHPHSIDGLLALGKIAVAENHVNQIISTYQKILSIDPNNANAYYNLGVYYYNSGDIDTAERFFNRAVRVGNHVDAHLYLGHIYQAKGLINKAIEEYRLRIRYKKGFNDPYADEARKRLYNLMKPDSSILKNYGKR